MTAIDSIILGIVEGLTEYLPVSSTGHLLVTQYLLGLPNTDAAKAFAICIQGGAILAVLGLYSHHIKDMIMGVCGKNPQGLRLLINLMLAFIPAVVIGLIFGDWIKSYLFDMWPIVVAWFVGGVGILIYARSRQKSQLGNSGKTIDELTPLQAIIIGFLQCIAMWPGVSRSLMTMVGGMFVGLSVVAAVEFSFLLGLITLSAATCYDAYKHGSEMITQFDVLPLILGGLFAWLFAVIAIKWMISYLQKHSFAVFGWYRIIAAIALTLLICYTSLS